MAIVIVTTASMKKIAAINMGLIVLLNPMVRIYLKGDQEVFMALN